MLHRVECTDCSLPGLRIIDILSERSFPRHAHDHYGVGIMLDGGHVSWSGRGHVEAGPNHIITVSPNEIHDGIPIRDTPRRWRMMFADPLLIAENMGIEVAAREFPMPAIVNPKLARSVAIALHDLPDIDAHEAAAIVVDLFGILLDKPGKTKLVVKRSHFVQRMLERIHDNPAETPSLMELANIAGLLPYTALRQFRRELGVTPHAYLVQYRVRLVYKAICKGASLAEAALVTGFADQSHMTRAFVRQFGVTPGQWRSSQISSRRAL